MELEGERERAERERRLQSEAMVQLEQEAKAREAAELQLAHKFGSAVEHAYYRTDLIDERAALLQRWHQFLEGN